MSVTPKLNNNSSGRWLGLALIVIATIATATILRIERHALNNNSTLTGAQESAVAGVNQAFWNLPVDELLGFVLIPAGEFLMGSDPAIDRLAYTNEVWPSGQRRGRVVLNDFYIGRYEVTVAQFKTFVEASQHPVAAETLAGELDYPVTHITLPDALAYCRWLQAQMLASKNLPAEIEKKLQQGWRVTLPTEAQWEKAARGAQGRIYPWGNNATTTFANYHGDHLRPVGSKPCPNCNHKLADMAGNAWELTRSYYLPYPYNPEAQPDLESDALFVMRGGSFADNEQNVRTAVRGGVDPGARNPAIGFRLVLSAD